MTKLDQVQMAIDEFTGKFGSPPDWVSLSPRCGGVLAAEIHASSGRLLAGWFPAPRGGHSHLKLGSVVVCVDIRQDPSHGVIAIDLSGSYCIVWTGLPVLRPSTTHLLCECGSAKVGSTNHSSWCPVKS